MIFRPVHGLGFGLALLVTALDQAIKWLVTGPLELAQAGSIKLFPFFDLTYAENNGVSLNFLATDTALGRWLLVSLTAGIALVVTVWMLRERVRGEVLSLALVLGGALGNILDRARLGHVVDYADLHFGDVRPFMIFNLADAAITIGIVIILARSFLSREKRPTQPDTAPET